MVNNAAHAGTANIAQSTRRSSKSTQINERVGMVTDLASEALSWKSAVMDK